MKRAKLRPWPARYPRDDGPVSPEHMAHIAATVREQHGGTRVLEDLAPLFADDNADIALRGFAAEVPDDEIDEFVASERCLRRRHDDGTIS